jgi:putative peptidoglycan lipid II flippase
VSGPADDQPEGSERAAADERLSAIAELGALEGPLEVTAADPTGHSLTGKSGAESNSAVLRSSVLMGTGTVVSRISGVVRGSALAAAIGIGGVLADLFALGNTLPNIIYILIIGGSLNAVFIPQLVRHMKTDQDEGKGFADRLLTLVGVALLITTLVAVLIAPWIVKIYVSNQWSPQQISLAVDITRYCLPQIFFYGVYTMLSQVLNSRGHFGAPMFAPIVNNVVSVAAFLAFFWLWGTNPARDGVLTPVQTAVLGLGATIGVAAQAIVLVPYLRRSGYHYRPRFDWRGSGLGHAGGLAFWTIGLVLVNQVAYVFIVRLLGDAGAASTSQATLAGLATYQNARLIFILPHSIITVSLVTALMPRMSRAASDERWTDLGAQVAGGARTAAAAILPATAVLIVLGPAIAELVYGYGAANNDPGSVLFLGQIVAIFAVALLPFTTFYLVLRGWYALEATQTAFWVTVVLNAFNLIFAFWFYDFVQRTGRSGAAAVAGITVAYVVAYWITALIAWRMLSRRLGGLQTFQTVRSMVRMTIAAGFALLLMYLVQTGVHHVLSYQHKLLVLLDLAVVGAVGLGAYLLAARVLHIGEVNEVVALVRQRIPGLH